MDTGGYTDAQWADRRKPDTRKNNYLDREERKWKKWYIWTMRLPQRPHRKLVEAMLPYLQSFMEMLNRLWFCAKHQSSYRRGGNQIRRCDRSQKEEIYFTAEVVPESDNWVFRSYTWGIRRIKETTSSQQNRASCHSPYLQLKGPLEPWRSLSWCWWDRFPSTWMSFKRSPEDHPQFLLAAANNEIVVPSRAA